MLLWGRGYATSISTTPKSGQRESTSTTSTIWSTSSSRFTTRRKTRTCSYPTPRFSISPKVTHSVIQTSEKASLNVPRTSWRLRRILLTHWKNSMKVWMRMWCSFAEFANLKNLGEKNVVKKEINLNYSTESFILRLIKIKWALKRPLIKVNQPWKNQ